MRALNTAGFSSYSNVASVTTPTVSAASRIKDITFEGGALVNATNGVDKVVGAATLENTNPLKGSYSARIPNLASTYLEDSFTATDDVYISLYIRLNALPASDARIVLVSNAGASVGNIVLRTTGRLRLRVDATAVGAESAVLQVGQLYRLGIHQKRGSGSNAVLEAFLAAGDAAFTTPFASTATGTWITPADRLRARSDQHRGRRSRLGRHPDRCRRDARALHPVGERPGVAGGEEGWPASALTPSQPAARGRRTVSPGELRVRHPSAPLRPPRKVRTCP